MSSMHVLPRNDLVLHEPNDECVCVPECCPNELPDGSIVYVYVHHALAAGTTSIEAAWLPCAWFFRRGRR